MAVALLWLGSAIALVVIVWGLWTGGRMAVGLTELVGESGRPFEAGQRAWFMLHRRGAFGPEVEDRRILLARAHARVLVRLFGGVALGVLLMVIGASLR